MSHDLNERQEQLEKVIAEYLESVDAGLSPEPERYLQKYPDLALDLKEFFEGQAEIEELAAEPAPLDESYMPVDVHQATLITDSTPALQPTLLHSTEPTIKGRPSRRRVGYFGDYELLREIARGGMGVVYKARQVNLDRIVALKMILAGQLASEEDVRRFYQEAEAAANLEHPGIVPIFEVGEREGQHFFSMGYVGGPSLAELIANGPLPPKPAAEIVKLIAEAIAYAHERGVIHRDLKPANILMARGQVRGDQSKSQTVLVPTPEGRSETADYFQPKVTDFGLAKKSEGGSELTGTGQILGTPSYMPPEQASGQTQHIGPLADVYSLGAILYCLLTGRPPFQSDNVMDTLLQVLEQEPVSPRDINPRVPKDLETICLKCLQKDRRKRYSSAHALAEELGRHLRGEPILARPVSKMEYAWRWCRRNPVVASLTSLIALLLVGGTIVAWSLAIQAERHAKQSEQNAERAELHATAAENLASEKTELAKRESDAKHRAIQAQAAAVKAADETKAAQLETTRLLYVARVNLAQRAWNENNVGRVLQLLEETKPEHTGGHDLRGFEWHYLWHLCHANQRTSQAKGHLYDVAVSPDATIFATSGRTVQLWDGKTLQELRSLPHPDAVEAIAFSPDGQSLATGCRDAIVRVWDIESEKLLHEFQGHSASVMDVAFHPQGEKLASVAGDYQLTLGREGAGEISLWDLRVGKLERDFPKQIHPVFQVKFSPDGTQLATGDRAGWLRLWNHDTGVEVKSWRAGSAGIRALAFSVDGQRLACGGWASTPLRLFRVSDGERLLEITDHGGDVNGVVFHPDGRTLMSCGKDQTVCVWDAVTGERLRQLRGHSDAVIGLAQQPSRGAIVSIGQYGTIKVWNLSEPSTESSFTTATREGVDAGRLVFSRDTKRIAVLKGFPWNPASSIEVLDPATQSPIASLNLDNKAHAIAMDSQGQRLATGHSGFVTLWDAGTLKQLHEFQMERAQVQAVAFSPDDKWLAAADENSRIRVWRTDTQALGFELRHDGGQTASKIAFCPNGRYLALADFAGLAVWDVHTKESVFAQNFKSYNKRLVFSHDGRLLACTHGPRVRFYDVASWVRTREFEVHKELVTGLAFSPDGKRLATCSGDLTMKLWDVATAQETFTKIVDRPTVINAVAFDSTGSRLYSAGGQRHLTVLHAKPAPETKSASFPIAWWHGHTGTIRGLDISPDGKLAASASGWPNGDKTARIWNVKTGQTLQILKGHIGDVQSVRFLPDGRHVLTGSLDNTLRLWDIETGEEIRQLNGRFGGVEKIAIFPDGRWAASAGLDKTLRLWDLESGEEQARFNDFPERLLSVAVSPDGKRVLGASGSKLFLWNVADEKLVRVFEGHEKAVDHTTFSEDGQHFASAGPEGAFLWNLEQTDPELRLPSGSAYHVAFTPDGKLLITAGGDGSVRVWDVKTGNELHRLADHQHRVWAIALSPDGQWLLSGGGADSLRSDPAVNWDNTIRRWRFPSPKNSGSTGK